MIKIKSHHDMSRLRRIALSSQGLLQAKPFGQGVAGARKAIEHMGYIQIDTISVVERAHNHVLHSRVPNFKPEMINQMLASGHAFEYWSHAAAFLPMLDFRFSLPYKHAIKSGQTHWNKAPDAKLMAELLVRIKSDGPLRSRDVEHKRSKQAGWWDWKPAKKALEQLYMQGDLMVNSRMGFQKVYDLTERVLPSDVNLDMPRLTEYAAHFIDSQLRCHGLVSLKGLTYLRRNTALRKTVKNQVDERVAAGSLEEIQLPTGDSYFIEAGAFERRLPRLSDRMLILSPFDNSVIQRDRLKAIFDFDYQIECYVPAAKRKYGYFSLPLLYRGEFIGRMDCKAHRKERRFEIKSLHFERHQFDQEVVNAAFVEAVKQFMVFQACDSVTLTEVKPKGSAQALQRALTTLN